MQIFNHLRKMLRNHSREKQEKNTSRTSISWSFRPDPTDPSKCLAQVARDRSITLLLDRWNFKNEQTETNWSDNFNYRYLARRKMATVCLWWSTMAGADRIMEPFIDFCEFTKPLGCSLSVQCVMFSLASCGAVVQRSSHRLSRSCKEVRLCALCVKP